MSEVHVTAIPLGPDTAHAYTIECTICGPVEIAPDEHQATQACIGHLLIHGVTIPQMHRHAR